MMPVTSIGDGDSCDARGGIVVIDAMMMIDCNDRNGDCDSEVG